ncbi:MAG: component of the polarisome [Alyxoria varia]|nr:MAG: component of the polarisome [Alyxoria varia]
MDGRPSPPGPAPMRGPPPGMNGGPPPPGLNGTPPPPYMNGGPRPGPPGPPGPPGINNRGAPPPSPPYSRSSNASGLYPAPPPPEGRTKYSARALEEQLHQHHRVLKEFLSANKEEHLYQMHNRARDKLLRLSPIQFQELSTDVYDELLRRKDEAREKSPHGTGRSIPKYLLPKNNFHPKRNQARQKLSTLAGKKFRELATDVLFELERRFPRFTGHGRSPSRGPPSRPGTGMSQIPNGIRRPSTSSAGPYSPGIFDSTRSMPRSNTMVPNKGTMVEDDDDAYGDDDDPYDFDQTMSRSSRRTTQRSMAFSTRDAGSGEYQQQIASLEQKIDELESQIRDKDEGAEKFSSHISDLERQLRSSESLTDTLQQEVDSLKASGGGSGGGGDWKNRYEALEEEFHQQRNVTEEVRHEAAQHLDEMRKMAQTLNVRNQNEEKLSKQVEQLEISVENWKSRHAKSRAQLRNLKASSMSGMIQQPTAEQFAKHAGYLDQRGVVKDVNITKFQGAIDELLRVSRSEEPPATLQFMQSIVTCVRHINDDIDKTPVSKDLEQTKTRAKLKAKIAATTNNLITVAKNHAVSEGMAPVSLVDAAASHLTMAVVELVKVVKIRPTPAGELDDGDFS